MPIFRVHPQRGRDVWEEEGPWHNGLFFLKLGMLQFFTPKIKPEFRCIPCPPPITWSDEKYVEIGGRKLDKDLVAWAYSLVVSPPIQNFIAIGVRFRLRGGDKDLSGIWIGALSVRRWQDILPILFLMRSVPFLVCTVRERERERERERGRREKEKIPFCFIRDGREAGIRFQWFLFFFF